MTGEGQRAVIVKPPIEKLMPAGTPEMVTDSDVAPGSANVIVPISALPATPVSGAAVMTGPGAEIVILNRP